jgi:hypothetical protein
LELRRISLQPRSDLLRPAIAESPRQSYAYATMSFAIGSWAYTLFRGAVVAAAYLALVACASLAGQPPNQNPVGAGLLHDPPSSAHYPTLQDLWQGRAQFDLDQADTGLPMGESDTIVLPDGRYRAYVHASDISLGVVDSCGDPVPFPGCIVAFESRDAGLTFQPLRSKSGRISCMMPCRSCPCDSRRDHVDQQQYPRVATIPPVLIEEIGIWLLVYEYRATVFLRTSNDGLNWSAPAELPQSGIWQTWLMPCRAEESIGPHPHAPDHYDCLVGSPPGIAVANNSQSLETFVFVGIGQNPGSMGCYRGYVGSHPTLLRKCDSNPLFTGAPTYGVPSQTGPQANTHFDFRTISSAEVTMLGDRYYMLYEGVRGPESGAPGDTQFALGLARSLSPHIDGPWETYPGNPILVDLPGNVGVGHADLVIDNGKTILFTSLDGETRSRLVLRSNQEDH